MLNAFMNGLAWMLHAPFVGILLNDYNWWIFYDWEHAIFIFPFQFFTLYLNMVTFCIFLEWPRFKIPFIWFDQKLNKVLANPNVTSSPISIQTMDGVTIRALLRTYLCRLTSLLSLLVCVLKHHLCVCVCGVNRSIICVEMTKFNSTSKD